MKNSKKILVTGAKGQLGKKIIDLLGNKYDLILTDSEEMDITDKSKVLNVVESEEPNFIIHGAAYTKVDLAEEEKELCFKINAEGSKNLAEVAKSFDIPIIYISTDYVFDGEKGQPYREEDDANPLSVYGKSKFDGEEYVRNICEKYYILRVAWLFGELPEGHTGTNFVETMLRLGRERDSLTVVNDQIGSPTYTKDLVELMDRIVSSWQLVAGSKNNREQQTANRKSVPFGTYHFSGNGPCSWYDFAKEIFKIVCIDINLKPIASDQYPQKAKRPPYTYLSKEKIEKTMNFKVRDWQKMVKEYLQ
jgi:dTDP-4-dehydrorhamnose reductase